MLTIEGRQVEVELMSIPELGGPVIPSSLKRKLLDQLNWQDFVRLHCRRRNLGFSAQDCFHSVWDYGLLLRVSTWDGLNLTTLSVTNFSWPRYENRGSFYDKNPLTEALSWTQLVPVAKSPVLTLKFNEDWLVMVWRFLKSWLWLTQTWPSHAR